MADGKGPRIAVVGAGVIGLTTATLVQDALPNAKVTIFGEQFLTETTSDGAAGIFRPDPHFTGPSKELTKKWLKDSFAFYMKLLKGRGTPEEAEAIGLVSRKAYFLSTTTEECVRNFYLENLLDDFRPLTEPELRSLSEGSDYRHGSVFTTLVTNCRVYLPFLTKKFLSNGGTIVAMKVKSFEDLSDSYDMVFNCSGLGSAKLCNDDKVLPIRGQVIKMMAPWVTHIYYVDSDTYIIPGTGGIVTLGGTRQFGSTNPKVNRHDSAAIWERCVAAVPSLKKGKVDREWVGFRPYRPEVRVEAEVMTYPSGKSVQVVHNYGHGGYGVMTAPGTSMHAVSLGLKCLRNGRASKL